MSEHKAKFQGGTPIVLGGETYYVVDVAPRQLRRAVPLLAGLAHLTSPDKLDEKSLDSLFEAIWLTVHRNYPTLGYEEFLDLPIKLPELQVAISQILPHLGMTVVQGGAAPGEALGEAPTS